MDGIEKRIRRETLIKEIAHMQKDLERFLAETEGMERVKKSVIKSMQDELESLYE